MSGSVLKAAARRVIFRDALMLLFISLVFVAGVSVISWLSFRLPGNINSDDIISRLASGVEPSLSIIYTNFRPAGVVLALILSLLHPILDAGFVSYCMKANRNEQKEMKDLLNGFLHFIKLISIFILSMIFIFLWSLLFLIPGIVAAYRYRMAVYILFDDPGKSALQCISESKALMYGGKLDLLIIDISFWGWRLLDIAVISLIPFSFVISPVSVWLSPYFGLTMAGYYQSRMAQAAV